MSWRRDEPSHLTIQKWLLVFVFLGVRLADGVGNPVALGRDDGGAHALEPRQVVEGDVALLRGVGGQCRPGRQQGEGQAEEGVEKICAAWAEEYHLYGDAPTWIGESHDMTIVT